MGSKETRAGIGLWADQTTSLLSLDSPSESWSPTRRHVGAAMLTLGLIAGAASGAPGDQSQKLTAVDAAADDQFGAHVDVSSGVAISGAPQDDDAGSGSGAAYLFDAVTGAQLFKLTASDATTSDEFGAAVAISGSTAIVGASSNDDPVAGVNAGSAYLFDVATGSQLFKLTSSDLDTGDFFGTSVAISGNLAVVGAFGDDDGGSTSGAAYVFDASTGAELLKLTASDALAGDFFGNSVAIDGNTVLVQASGRDDLGNNSGAVYAFDATTGAQLHKFLASDGAAGDGFGSGLGVSGNTAVIGSKNHDSAGSNAGAAYVFDLTTGSETMKLTASDAAASANYGFAVDLSGNIAVIGAQGSSPGATSFAGAAYLVDVTSGAEITQLVANDAADFDSMAESVAIDGSLAIAGAAQDDDAGNASGSAYVFEVGNAPLADILYGTTDGEWFGHDVRVIPDVTGDGIRDFLTSAADANSGQGFARVYSGATRTEVWTAWGDALGDQFGWRMDAFDDVTGDGIVDVVVGTRGRNTGNPSNYVKVLDGATGASLQRINSDSLFGYNVNRAGDVNGDGHQDFAVGAPGSFGRFSVYSGNPADNFAQISQITTGETNFGIDLGKLDDVNGDGFDDVLVSSGGSGAWNGRVRIYSGQHLTNGSGPEVLGQWDADNSGDRLFVVTSEGADVNGDGIDDFAMGSYYADGQRGHVDLMLSGTGGTFTAQRYFDPNPVPGNEFGVYVELTDLDGNGIPDLQVAGYNPNGVGRVHVFQDMQTDYVCTYEGLPGEWYGSPFAPGDIDGDGTEEILVGSIFAANPTLGIDTGSLAIESYPGNCSLPPSQSMVTLRLEDQNGDEIAGSVFDIDEGAGFVTVNTGTTLTLDPGTYPLRFRPGINGVTDNRAPQRSESLVVTGSGTATYVWEVADVVLNLADQNGVPIPGADWGAVGASGLGTAAAGSVLRYPVTEDPSLNTVNTWGTGYIFTFRPGINGNPHPQAPSRTEVLEIPTGGVVFDREWRIEPLTVNVVDQNGDEITGSDWQPTGGTGHAPVSTGTSILMPVTEDPAHSIGGTWGTGYRLDALPIVNNGITGQVARAIINVEVEVGGTTLDFPWHMVRGEMYLVDDTETPVSGATFDIGSVASGVTNGTPFSLPVTEYPLPDTRFQAIRSNFGDGYQINLMVPSGSTGLTRFELDETESFTPQFVDIAGSDYGMRFESYVTFVLNDQHGDEIAASHFTLNPGNIVVETGSTVALDPGTYSVRIDPGLAGLWSGATWLHRNDTLEVTGGAQAATFVWDTAGLTVEIQDQNGAAIPGSEHRISYGGWGQIANGSTVTVPVTEGYPNMGGVYEDGYNLTLMPGLGGQSGGLTYLQRAESDLEVTSAGLATTFEWKTAPLTVKVQDQTGTAIPASEYRIGFGGWGQVANGASITVPVTEGVGYESVGGVYADGYNLTLMPGLGGLAPGLTYLTRPETGLEVTDAGVTQAYEWETLSGTIHVVDASEVELIGGSFTIQANGTLGYSSGDAFSLPATTGYPSIGGIYADGYDINFQNPAGGVRAIELNPGGTFSPNFVDIGGSDYGLRPNLAPVVTFQVVDQNGGLYGTPGVAETYNARFDISQGGQSVGQIFQGDSIQLDLGTYDVKVWLGQGTSNFQIRRDDSLTITAGGAQTAEFVWETADLVVNILDEDTLDPIPNAYFDIWGFAPVPAGTAMTVPVTESPAGVPPTQSTYSQGWAAGLLPTGTSQPMRRSEISPVLPGVTNTYDYTWKRRPITVTVVDQFGDEIPGSYFGAVVIANTPSGTASDPVPVTEDPDHPTIFSTNAAGYQITMRAGVNGVVNPGILKNLPTGTELTAAGIDIEAVWPSVHGSLHVVDANGDEVTDASWAAFFGAGPSGTIVSLPVTDDPNGQPFSTYANGYPINITLAGGSSSGAVAFELTEDGTFTPQFVNIGGNDYGLAFNLAPEVTFQVVDQNGGLYGTPGVAETYNARFDISQGGQSVGQIFQGDSIELDLGTYDVKVWLGQGTSNFQIRRDDSLTITAGGAQTAEFVWETADLVVNILDEDTLDPIPNADFDIWGYSAVDAGTALRVPVTESPAGVSPTGGTYSQGWAAGLLPTGINQAMRRSEISPVLSGVTNTYDYTWKRRPIMVTVVDQFGDEIPGSYFSTVVTGNVPSGTASDPVPVTEDPDHPNIFSTNAAGYQIVMRAGINGVNNPGMVKNHPGAVELTAAGIDIESVWPSVHGSLHVVDANGDEVTDASWTAFFGTGSSGTVVSLPVTEDPNGQPYSTYANGYPINITLAGGSSSGSVAFELTEDGTFTPQSVTIDGNDYGLAFNVPQNVVVTGTVTSDCGGPLEGVTVTVIDDQGGNQTALTDAAGAYSVSEVPIGATGTVSITVPLGYEIADGGSATQAVTFDQDLTIDYALDCVLVSIAGHVDSDCEGAAEGVDVTLTLPGGATESAVTAFDGSYLFSDLDYDEGLVTVSITVPPFFVAGAGGTSFDVDLTQDQTVDFEIACEYVDVSGVISSDCAGPLLGVTVDLDLDPGNPVPSVISTLTDSTGSYRFSDVRASAVLAELTAATPLGYIEDWPADADTSLVPNGDLVQDFTLLCDTPVGEAQKKGFWKHLAKDYLKRGKEDRFNRHAMTAGTTIWFSSVFDYSCVVDATLWVDGGTVTFEADGVPYTLDAPDAVVHLSSTATEASTTWMGTHWESTIPISADGHGFLTGFAWDLPVDLPGRINPVVWEPLITGQAVSDPGIEFHIHWRWSAAAYSSFGTDPSTFSVKPVDDDDYCWFGTGDRAGTPDAFKTNVIKGATGKGDSNYTGNLSSRKKVELPRKESFEDLSENHPLTIFEHFYENTLNSIQVEGITYVDEGSGPEPISIEVMHETLRHKADNSELARAKAQYLSLLLNVASGRLLTSEVVSEDGATASQALQQVAAYILDTDFTNDKMAKKIARKINRSKMVPAGWIDLGIEDISYRHTPVILHVSMGQNPFRGSTKMQLAMPEAADYEVAFFDVAGRRVRGFQGQSGPGFVDLEWDGRDDKGTRLSPGVYLYRTRIGKELWTGKLTLMR